MNKDIETIKAGLKAIQAHMVAVKELGSKVRTDEMIMLCDKALSRLSAAGEVDASKTGAEKSFAELTKIKAAINQPIAGTGNPATAPLVHRTIDEDGNKVVVVAEWWYDGLNKALTQPAQPDPEREKALETRSFVRGFARCLSNAVSLESWRPEDIGGGMTLQDFIDAGCCEKDIETLCKYIAPPQTEGE